MIRSNFKQLLEEFTLVAENEFEDAMPFFKEVSLRKGAFFVKEGKICRNIAYINSGILRSFYFNEKGEEITYCFSTPHNIETSFKSFTMQVPSAFSIQALEDAKLLVIEYENLQHLYNTSKTWEKIGRLLSEKAYFDMEEHASKITNETAKEKYLRLINEQPLIIKKSPLIYISSYLGITPRHLSRLRKEIISGLLSSEKV